MLLALMSLAAEMDGDVWSWLYQNISIQGILNITGLSLVVILFSRDLILTKGQHERRVGDIVKSYDAQLQAKDDRYNDMLREKGERYSEMRESRDTYRDGSVALEDRNRELTDAVVDGNKALAVGFQALQSLEVIAQEEGGRNGRS